MRKYYRNMVRCMAERRGSKPSKAVHNWRKILGLYSSFEGQKRQKPGSKQPILVYPMPKGGTQ